MRRTILLFVVSFAALAADDAHVTLAIGSPAPDFALPGVDGKTHKLSDYSTSPLLAIDARTGRQLWHFKWKTTGGIHIGNRGVGIYGDWLFFETPDDFLSSLDKNTGKLRWSVEIADVKQQYFATPAPLIIGNHVIVGVGGDSLDVPWFLQAHDPSTPD